MIFKSGGGGVASGVKWIFEIGGGGVREVSQGEREKKCKIYKYKYSIKILYLGR